MNKNIFLGAAFLIFFGCEETQCQTIDQQVIATSGMHATNSTHQLSWTIGEAFIHTYTGTSSTLTQGFHQTNLLVTAVQTIDATISINAFPNPTMSRLNVAIKQSSNAVLTLTNINGQVLFSKTIEDSDYLCAIEMNDYPSGLYFLNVTNTNKQLINTHQIIKQ